METYWTNSLKEKLRLLDETGIELEPEELEIYGLDTLDIVFLTDVKNEGNSINGK